MRVPDNPIGQTPILFINITFSHFGQLRKYINFTFFPRLTLRDLPVAKAGQMNVLKTFPWLCLKTNMKLSDCFIKVLC